MRHLFALTSFFFGLLTGLAAHAQGMTMPAVGDYVTTQTGLNVEVAETRIVGTLFGQQVWVFVTGDAAIHEPDADCVDGGCWVFVGKL